MISIDKEGCAELPSIESEECKFKVEGNSFYVSFPFDTYSTYGFGCNEGGKLGLKDAKQSEEPSAIPELANVNVKAIASLGRHTQVIFYL